MKELATDLQKDGSHQNPQDTKRIVRFPGLIRRFSRRNAEDVAFYRRANRIAELEKKAGEWIERGREPNIELGRVFNQIKALLKHGDWKPNFSKKFLPRGVALRTAQEYMKMAREADEITKNADSALFPPATDQPAQAINDANEKDKAAVAAAREQSPEAPDKETKKTHKKRVRLEGIYKLPLHMTGEQKDATDLLLESKKWSRAERKIMGLLQQLHIKYGFLNHSEKEEKDGSN